MRAVTDPRPSMTFTDLRIGLGLALPVVAGFLVLSGWLATTMGISRMVGVLAGAVLVAVFGFVVLIRRHRHGHPLSRDQDLRGDDSDH